VLLSAAFLSLVRVRTNGRVYVPRLGGVERNIDARVAHGLHARGEKNVRARGGLTGPEGELSGSAAVNPSAIFIGP